MFFETIIIYRTEQEKFDLSLPPSQKEMYGAESYLYKSNMHAWTNDWINLQSW